MRTEEQIAADEALTEAIQQVLIAYDFQQDCVIGDYLIVCAQSRLDGDGEASTAYTHLYRNGDLPAHSILGLLDIARVRMQHHVNEGF